MSTDTIIVAIDDSQLAALEARLDSIALKATTTLTGTTVRRGALTSTLPSINREMRIILGQLPGMRMAIRQIWNIKRLERGLLRDAGVPGWNFYIALLATIIIALRWVLSLYQRAERERKKYEAFIRRERGLTRGEYRALMTEWKDYLRNMPG